MMLNNRLKNIIIEEIENIMCEISAYDTHLIPKEVYWSDDEIIEFLLDKKSISKIISDVTYRKQTKQLYENLIYSTKLDIIEFILKYNLNTEEESQNELEKMSIKDLEEYIPIKLNIKEEKEYKKIIYEFVNNLVNEDIINKNNFVSLK